MVKFLADSGLLQFGDAMHCDDAVQFDGAMSSDGAMPCDEAMSSDGAMHFDGDSSVQVMTPQAKISLNAESVGSQSRSPQRYFYPKHLRLRSRAQFLKVTRRDLKADFKTQSAAWLLLGRQNGESFSRLGVTVTRKVACAVVRNRLKRSLREFFRLNHHKWPVNLDLVFIARGGAAEQTAQVLAQDLARFDQQLRALN